MILGLFLSVLRHPPPAGGGQARLHCPWLLRWREQESVFEPDFVPDSDEHPFDSFEKNRKEPIRVKRNHTHSPACR
jgi:hypothetical protein